MKMALLSFLAILLLTLSLTAEAARILGTSHGPIIHLFGSQPATVAFNLSDPTPTAVLISEDDICDTTDPQFFLLPPTPNGMQEITLSRASIPFAAADNFEFSLCNATNGAELPFKVLVLPEVSGVFEGTSETTVYAPLRNVLGDWSRSLVVRFPAGSDHEGFAAPIVPIFGVAASDSCNSFQARFFMTAIGADGAEVTSNALASFRNTNRAKLCVAGTPLGLRIIPVQSVFVDGVAVSPSSAKSLELPPSGSSTLQITAFTTTDSTTDVAESAFEVVTCAPTVDWSTSTSGSQVTVIASGFQPASLCADFDGMQLSLGISLSVFEFTSIAGAPRGSVLQQVFDGSSGAQESSGVNTWAFTTQGSRPSGIRLFLSTQQCQSASIPTQQNRFGRVAGDFITFPLNWTSSGGTYQLCGITVTGTVFDTTFDVFAIVVSAVYTTGTSSGTASVQWLGGTSSVSIMVQGSFPSGSSVTAGLTCIENPSSASSVSGSSATGPITVSTALAPFTGRFCITVFNATGAIISTTPAGRFEVTEFIRVGINDAHAAYLGATTLDVRLSSSSLIGNLAVDIGCIGTFVLMPTSQTIPLPLLTQGSHDICWRQSSSSTTGVRATSIEILPQVAAVSLPDPFLTSPTGKPIVFPLNSRVTFSPRARLALAVSTDSSCANARLMTTTSFTAESSSLTAPLPLPSGGVWHICSALASPASPPTSFPTNLGSLTAYSITLDTASSGSSGSSTLAYPLSATFSAADTEIVSFGVNPQLPSGTDVYLSVSSDPSCVNVGTVLGPFRSSTTSVSIPLGAAANLSSQSAVVCGQLGSANAAGFRSIGIRIALFNIESFDDETVIFGGTADPVYLSVLAGTQRTVEVSGTNLQYLDDWRIRFFTSSTANCADTEDLSLPLRSSHDGSEGFFFLPPTIRSNYQTVCVSTFSGNSIASNLRTNVRVFVLPYTAFGAARSDNVQQSVVVATVGRSTFIRVLKTALSVPTPSNNVSFDFVSSTEACSVASDIVPLARSVETSDYVLLEVPPDAVQEGIYRICSVLTIGTDLRAASIGINLVMLELTVSGLSIVAGGHLATPVGQEVLLYVNSDYLREATVTLALTDETCSDSLTGNTALGVSRLPVTASGCGSTGNTATFGRPNSTSSATNVTLRICFAVSSSRVNTPSSALRFTDSGIELFSVPSAATIELRYVQQPTQFAPGAGPLAEQPDIGLFEASSGIRYASIPFDVDVTASWQLDETGWLTGESYSATFEAGTESLNFGVSSQKISFMSSLHGLAYSLLIDAHGTAINSILSVSSHPVFRAECGTETLVGLPRTNQCVKCPSEAYCDGSASMMVQGSYWRSSNLSSNFYSCAAPFGGASCLNGTSTGSCVAGHTGPRCTVCEPDYGKTSNGRCSRCEPHAVVIVIIALLALIVTYSIVMMSTMRCKKSDQFPTYFKIFVNHITISALFGEMTRYFPTAVRVFFHLERQVAMPSPEFSDFQCTFGTTWHDNWLIVNLIVPAIAILALIGAAIHSAITANDQPETEVVQFEGDALHAQHSQHLAVEKEKLTLGRRWCVVMIAIVFLAYPVLVAWNVRVFRCDDIDFGAPTVTGVAQSSIRSLFAYDRSVECDSERHQRYQKAGIALIIVWGVGLPLLFVGAYGYLMRSARRGGMGYTKASRAFTFIIGGYRKNVWFWETFIFLRKFLVIIVVYFVEGSELQTLLVSWIIAAAFGLHERVKPLEYETTDLLERISLLSLFVTLSLALLSDFTAGDTTTSTSTEGFVIGYIILAFNILILLWMLYVILPEGVHRFRVGLYQNRASLRKAGPLGECILKFSLSDVVWVKMLDPDGSSKVVPQREEDMMSDWSESDDDDDDLHQGKHEPHLHGARRKQQQISDGPAGADSSSDDDDDAVVKAAKDEKKTVDGKVSKPSNTVVPEELRDDPQLDDEEKAQRQSLREKFNMARRKTLLASKAPMDLDEDTEAEDPERQARMEKAYKAGKAAQLCGDSVLQELEEIEPNRETRKRLENAYKQGKKAVQNDEIPEDLRDDMDGLSSTDVQHRQELQHLFKNGRKAQQQQDALSGLIDKNPGLEKSLLAAFESGKKAKPSSEGPTGDLEIDEETQARHKMMQQAFAAGRRAKADDDTELDELIRKEPKLKASIADAFHRGRRATTAGQSATPLDDEDEESSRRHALIQQAFVLGRKSQSTTSEPTEELDELVRRCPEIRSDLNAAFRRGKIAASDIDPEGLEDQDPRVLREKKNMQSRMSRRQTSIIADEDLDEESRVRFSLLQQAFTAGRKAKQGGTDPTTEDLARKNPALKHDIDQAFKRGQRASAVADSPVELEDVDEELERRQALHRQAFALGRKSLNNQIPAADSELELEELCNRCPAIRDDLKSSFAKGKNPASQSPSVMTDDELEDPEVLRQKKLLQKARVAGRKAQQAEAPLAELESMDEEKRRNLLGVFERGKRAARDNLKSQSAIPEELRDDAPGLTDEEVKVRRRMQAMYREGRAAQVSQQALVEALDEAPEREKKALTKAFEKGRNASKAVDVPVDESEETMTANPDRQRRSKQAFLEGRRAARLATVEALEEEELAPAPADTNDPMRDALKSLERQMEKSQRQIDEQLKLISQLTSQLTFAEEDNRKLKEELTAAVASASVANEMDAMLATINRLEEENAELRKKALPKLFAVGAGKKALSNWKSRATKEKSERTNQLQTILSEGQSTEAVRLQTLRSEKAAQEEKLRARLEAKRQGRQGAKPTDDATQPAQSTSQSNESTPADQHPTTDVSTADAAADAANEVADDLTKRYSDVCAQLDLERKANERLVASLKEMSSLITPSGSLDETKIRSWHSTVDSTVKDIEAAKADIVKERDERESRRAAIEAAEREMQQKKIAEKVAAKKAKASSVLNRYDAEAASSDDKAKQAESLAAIVSGLEAHTDDLTKEFAEAKQQAEHEHTTVEKLTQLVASLEEDLQTVTERSLKEKEELVAQIEALSEKTKGATSTTEQGDRSTSETSAKSRRWGQMSKLMKLDAVAGLSALIETATLKGDADKLNQAWSQAMEQLATLLGAKDHSVIDLLSKLFSSATEQLQHSISRYGELSEENLRQSKMLKFLKMHLKSTPTPKPTTIPTAEDNSNQQQELISKIHNEGKLKSEERLALERAERDKQNQAIQDRLEKKRAKRGGKGKPQSAGETKLLEQIMSRPQETATSSDDAVAAEPTLVLDDVVKNPAAAENVIRDLQSIIDGLKAHDAELMDKYSDVLEQLDAEKALTATLSARVENGGTGTGSAEMEQQLKELSAERDSLRSKLESIANQKSLTRVGDVKSKVKLWKAGADARAAERESGTKKVIQDSDKEQQLRREAEEAQRAAQQALIREQLQKKKEARQKRRKEELKEKNGGATPPPESIDPSFDMTANESISSSLDILEVIKKQEDASNNRAEPQSPQEMQRTIDNLRAAVDGLEAHNRQLLDQYAEAASKLKSLESGSTVLSKQLQRAEEIAMQADASLRAQLDEMSMLSAAIKELEESNTALKKGIIDPRSGSTAADMIKEMEVLKRRIALLEHETGVSTGSVQSTEVKQKLLGWNKSAQKTKKKREANFNALLSEAQMQNQLRRSKEEIEEQEQRQQAEDKLKAKLAKRRAKRGDSSGGAADGSEANEDAAVEEPKADVTAIDIGGDVVIPARRHKKLGEAAALSLLAARLRK